MIVVTYSSKSPEADARIDVDVFLPLREVLRGPLSRSSCHWIALSKTKTTLQFHAARLTQLGACSLSLRQGFRLPMIDTSFTLEAQDPYRAVGAQSNSKCPPQKTIQWCIAVLASRVRGNLCDF